MEAAAIHTHHVGGIYSSDVFYDERPDLNEQMMRHGILAVEMEAAELYNRGPLRPYSDTDRVRPSEHWRSFAFF